MVAKSSFDDPILCDSCRQMVFQYRFLSEIGQYISMLSFPLGLTLLIWEQWLLGTAFLVLTAVSFLGAQSLEITYTPLQKVEDKKQKLLQHIFSFLAFVITIGMLVLVVKVLLDSNTTWGSWLSEILNTLF
ncbi:hypothetical protein [Kaarinaea lacus]